MLANADEFSNSPWLSEGSKANAIEKLDAMIVNAAYPEFLQEGIIDLSQTQSAFEDVLLIRKQYIALIKKIVDYYNTFEVAPSVFADGEE